MDWHKRFVQQAVWTDPLRSYLFKQSGLDTANRVLEVGCGTGAILAGLTASAAIHGLDLAADRLVKAHLHAPQAILTCANALSLPYADGVFDITFCHFLLLWVHDPLQALREMKRVTRSGGNVLALAEPDYSARVDKPDTLVPLGRWQTSALQHQGADTGLGSRLADLFSRAGFQLIETGTLQTGNQGQPTVEEQDLEWSVLEGDLAGSVPANEIQRLRRLDESAWESHLRVLSVPTYFAWGQ